jgi:hypothetical protein
MAYTVCSVVYSARRRVSHHCGIDESRCESVQGLVRGYRNRYFLHSPGSGTRGSDGRSIRCVITNITSSLFWNVFSIS